MNWQEMFKILGPRSRLINQIQNGYHIVLKDKTVFQFKDFSGEYSIVDLYNDHMILLGSDNIRTVPQSDWDSMKLFTIK